jgi:predicted nucleic acid-binding protein
MRFCAAIAEDELRVIEAAPYDYRRMAELPTTYASLRLQVVDACVIAPAERLDLREVAAIDRRDFLVIAPRHLRKGDPAHPPASLPVRRVRASAPLRRIQR